MEKTLPNKNNPKILIADDNLPSLMLLNYIISELLSEVEIIEANNGTTVLEILKSTKVDIIFLDIMMPDFSGIEVAYLVKNESMNHETPIIAISAINFDNDRKIPPNLFSEYLRKPINVENINEILKKYISKI